MSDTLYVYYDRGPMLDIGLSRSTLWLIGVGLISETMTERTYLRRLERNDSLLWGIPDAAVAIEGDYQFPTLAVGAPRLSYDAAARTLRMMPTSDVNGHAGSEATVQVEVMELTGRGLLRTSLSAQTPELRLLGLPRGRLFVRATGAGGTTVLPIAVR